MHRSVEKSGGRVSGGWRRCLIVEQRTLLLPLLELMRMEEYICESVDETEWVFSRADEVREECRCRQEWTYTLAGTGGSVANTLRF